MLPVKSTYTTTRKVDPITLKEELMAGFPSFTVSYSVMADSFKLKNKDFRHILLYNTDRPGKLESTSLALRRKAFVYNLGLCLVVAILWFGDMRLND